MTLAPLRQCPGETASSTRENAGDKSRGASISSLAGLPPRRCGGIIYRTLTREPP
jgi:hypothetical protein